jgi:hypothetical protein
MSRRAIILVTLSLALGVFYGRFAVPWLLDIVPLERAVDDWNPDFEQEQAARYARREQAREAAARRMALLRAIAELEEIRREQRKNIAGLRYLQRQEEPVFGD